ncbi:MAG: hypothetical protein KDC43_06020 [Saprospiraceae bacterium]|nr:hypothetical protein [Saprospiraceae bacterium]MCB0623472.1 hypothetical protein [Saprospiraceae bacterium]MCB0682288.1 hypothetical protein [Saprospiraceae bacterium]
MKKSTYRLFFVILTASWLCGCSVKSDDPGIVVDIPKTFYVDLFEQLDTLQRKLIFKASSIEAQDCKNYLISHTYHRQNGTLFLSLNEILPPDECQPGEGAATADIEVGYLVEGMYGLEVNLKNTVHNIGTLTVNDEYFEIQLDSYDGIELVHSRLLRIPDHTVWGYVGYAQPGFAGPAMEFLHDLELIAESRPYDPGYYGYFTINVADEIVYSQSTGHPYTNKFMYQFDGNEQDLIDLIGQYRNQYPDGIDFYLVDDQGIVY